MAFELVLVLASGLGIAHFLEVFSWARRADASAPAGNVLAACAAALVLIAAIFRTGASAGWGPAVGLAALAAFWVVAARFLVARPIVARAEQVDWRQLSQTPQSVRLRATRGATGHGQEPVEPAGTHPTDSASPAHPQTDTARSPAPPARQLAAHGTPARARPERASPPNAAPADAPTRPPTATLPTRTPSEPPSPPAPPPPPAPGDPTLTPPPAFTLDPAPFRLHCRACGSAVTRPLREIRCPEPPFFYNGELTGLAYLRVGKPRSGTFWRSHQRWTSTREDENLLTGLAFGTQGRVLLLSPGDLDGSALPFEHRRSSEGCCGYWGGTGPNLRCHECGNWVAYNVGSCETPSFAAARLDEVELRPVAADEVERRIVVPPPSSVPIRLRCRRCDNELARPLREVAADRPPLFRHGQPVSPENAGGAEPRLGRFWRSFSPWSSPEGGETLAGVDFGRAGSVLLGARLDLLGIMFFANRYGSSRGDEGPNRGCFRCSQMIATEVYGSGLPEFVAIDVGDLRFEEATEEELRAAEARHKALLRKVADLEGGRARPSANLDGPG